MQELNIFISNHAFLAIAAALVVVMLLIVEFIRLKRQTFNISSSQATQLINHNNAVVIDIRSKENYRKGHIIDAHSYPSKELLATSKKIEKFKAKPIIIVCGAGIESQKVATFLIKQGYNAYSLNGGIRSWIDAQMPLVKE